jgi:hypothetical protein
MTGNGSPQVFWPSDSSAYRRGDGAGMALAAVTGRIRQIAGALSSLSSGRPCPGREPV